MNKVDQAGEAAVAAVDAFVAEHRAAAIPALIGACVMWSVDHGGKDVVQGTLRRAIKLADEMAVARRRDLA